MTKKKKGEDTGRRCWEDGGRDLRDAATSQGPLRVPAARGCVQNQTCVIDDLLRPSAPPPPRKSVSSLPTAPASFPPPLPFNLCCGTSISELQKLLRILPATPLVRKARLTLTDFCTFVAECRKHSSLRNEQMTSTALLI